MTIILAGRKIGRLTVIHSTTQRIGKSIVWRCICECGNQSALVSARDLLHSNEGRKGCGSCADTKDPLYSIWNGIKQRCFNRSNAGYKNYGGRGITMYPDWINNFLAFKAYILTLGSRLPGYSLDRKNNDGNYEPGNLRWADAVTQANNQRKEERGLSRGAIIDIFFSKKSVEACSREYRVSLKTVRNIRAKTYSPKATEICLSPTREEMQKFSPKISPEMQARLNAMRQIPLPSFPPSPP